MLIRKLYSNELLINEIEKCDGNLMKKEQINEVIEKFV
jgi:hypothetical protein